MSNRVVNGLNERFPDLKVIWVESGLAWALPDAAPVNSYMMRTSVCPSLKSLPSEYITEMYTGRSRWKAARTLDGRADLQVRRRRHAVAVRVGFLSGISTCRASSTTCRSSTTSSRNMLGDNAWRVLGLIPAR